MLKFTQKQSAPPEKRSAEERAKDFKEIFKRFKSVALKEQSERCSQCGVPFCQVHCPLGNHIPDWLMLAASGRLQEAYQVSSRTNNMPEICGRICPQDRLCEGNCVLEQSEHGTITIGAIEREITELAWDNGWVKELTIRADLKEKVAIIGAGPAGLAAAEELRQIGYQVEVFDRHDRMGGLLTYGIPNFKLDKSIVARRVERLERAGIQFHRGVDIGKDTHFQDLRKKYAAVLVATGVYQPRQLAIKGIEKDGVVAALDFLIASNRRGFGDEIKSATAEGKKVVVIGGGDTAMDCVRTAIRQNAAKVTCLYRRDRSNRTGSQREIQYAEEEGVEFNWLAVAKEITGNGKVSAVPAQRMRLTTVDSDGRRQVQAIEGDEFELDADLVILALGFTPEPLPEMFNCPELVVSESGTLLVDENLQTNLPGVFAAGDIARGASLVVWAIVDGRKVAQSIHSYIQGTSS